MVESPESASGDETVRDSPAQESMSRSCPVLPIPSKPPGFVPGYHFNIYASSCRLHRRLVAGFVRSVCSLATRVGPRRILEVGCGPGELALRLLAGFDALGPAPQYFGLDVSTTDVIAARRLCPRARFLVGSAYELPFANSSFDLVVVCETLEHLAEPSAALAEVRRVCGGFFLASVPWEPAWSLANLLRGEHIHRLGSTPGHLQRFTRTAFRRLIGARFELVTERRPLPWTVLLAHVSEQEHAIRIPTVWERETQFHGQTASEVLPLRKGETFPKSCPWHSLRLILRY